MKRAKNMSHRSRTIGESALVHRFEEIAAYGHTRQSELTLGVGDDAALLKPTPGYEVILSCDWFLEGSHFLRDKHPADAVGWKCLARALSDVAAMGGTPKCFLLSLALPASHTGHWFDQFLAGLRQAAKKFNCALAGGDTTQHQNILINVTVVGLVRKGRAIRRSGARPEDTLFVSGKLGEADLGLRRLRKSTRRVSASDLILKKHLYPEPRLALGQWLSEKRLASAMMDLSDGLSTDLPRLCLASGIGARIDAAKMPLVRVPWRGQKLHSKSLALALHGGDDYELLFAVPAKKLSHVPRFFQGTAITAIGKITKDRDLVLIDEDRHEVSLPNRGWDPFRTKD